MGHIVSKDGVKIYRERVEAISKVILPINKKEVQSFLGKRNFLRRFIAKSTKLLKYITCTLKNNSDVRWTPKARTYFEHIKKAIMEASVLENPCFSK